MKMPPLTGRIFYCFSRPFLGLFYSGVLRTRALIICGSEILLVRNWKGRQKWTLPGGGTKKGESSRQTLVRELQEELNLRFDEKLPKYLSRIDHKEASALYPVDVFELKLDEKPRFVMNQTELVDAKWISMHNLPEDIDELTRRVIEKQR